MKRSRGRNFTEADRDAIRILLSQKFSVRKIAAIMGRGKSGVQGQIDRMRADGTIDQGIMDLGQTNERR
jgi:IS30 family transposase